MNGNPDALLERDAEIETISRQLDEACAGNGSLLVVEGPAGIGKTTLLKRAMELGRERGMTIVYGRGGVLEQQIEYGVVRQMLEKAYLSADDAEREALLAGPAAPAASILGIGEPPADAGPGRDPSENILHGLYWLMANLAEAGPILAIFDDAHWGDGASLVASGYLSRRVEGHPIALMAGVRSDEPGSLARSLGPVFQDAGATMVHPKPLTADAVREILGATFTDEVASPDLVGAFLKASGGNPFFLTELVSELSNSHRNLGEISPDHVFDAGPVAVKRSLLMRLGALGDDSRKLAQALAILGGEGELRHAVVIAGLEPEAGALAADKLTAAGIVESGQPLRVAHPLVRAAIADDIPPSAQSAYHRNAFEILSREGATDDETTVHALNSDPCGDANLVEVLRRTADRSLRTGTPAAAVIHLKRALAEPPPAALRPVVVAELGRAEVRSGSFPEGLARIDQALEGLTDPDLRIAAQRDRGFAAFASGGMDNARQLIHGSLAELDDSESDGALRLEADLATLAWMTGGESGIDLKRHLGLPGDTAAQRLILGLLAQETHQHGAHPDEVIELANRALGNGRMIAEDTSESLGWYMAIYALLTCEALDDAKASIEQALADSVRRGSSFGRAAVLGSRAVVALNEGRLVDAEADARTAAAGGMAPIMVPVNASFTVRALAEQGKLEEAGQMLVDAGIEHGPGGPTVLRWIPWSRAILHEVQGNLEAVRVDVAPLLEDEHNNRSMKALPWRALLARTISRGGYSKEAERLSTDHLAWAEWWGKPAALGTAQRAFALSGPSELRAERLELAVETLAGSRLRNEEAKARLDHGIALLRVGQKSAGSDQLEAALEIAMSCGARLVAETAASELEIAGAAPKRLMFDELTASERRVAEFAAGGKTNREIADELFVTPKTVENHLTKVYSKLGIGSRQELEAAL
jgi:DNA-binding CsgD family transcriptional regulator